MTHRGPFQPLLFCDSVGPLPTGFLDRRSIHRIPTFSLVFVLIF